ncbi:MAG TPA: class I SAM-dependent methyltransferase [Anaerolineae bacterium]|nr:class I SAM-dependent methyltransferase [Anaerolineae bacterium]
MHLGQYYRLWQLARLRLRSEEDYRAFQAYQAELMLNYLRQHNIEVKGKSLVDLGSGIAGYSQQFARHGAQVISIDLTIPRQTLNFGLQPVCANALQVPLRNQSVDLIICASLIEHLASPKKLILEIERALKKGGYCYLSFPPFYSPLGGHEFAPYHYFGEKIALRLKKRRRVVPDWVREFYKVPLEPQSFANLYPEWGLYRMTIYRARQLLAGTKLTQIDLSTRYLPVSFVRWPLFGELLTWHVQFLLARTD